ncbi:MULTISPECIES: hypothetical protein [unclassified Bradyrhizobium]|uniref:hypothetical protein n=1 Tax=unclassified Bradyrhizobium TaxID=2631580 RepID=UPI0029161977|nr:MULTISPECIES: hypothetical protein [unclassified Bradyrhizobium]
MNFWQSVVLGFDLGLRSAVAFLFYGFATEDRGYLRLGIVKSLLQFDEPGKLVLVDQ